MRNPFSNKRPGLIKDLETARVAVDEIHNEGLSSRLAKIEIDGHTWAEVVALDAVREAAQKEARTYRSNVYGAEHRVNAISSELRATAPKAINDMRERVNAFAESTRKSFKPKLTESVELPDVFGELNIETSTRLDRQLFSEVMDGVARIVQQIDDLKLTTPSEKDCQKSLDVIATELARLESITWQAERLPVDADGEVVPVKRRRTRADTAAEPAGELKTVSI